MYIFYSLLTLFLTPFFYLWAYIRLLRGKENSARITERFAITKIKRPQGKLVWLHAASVGETLAILSLVNKLVEENFTILLTTYTLSSSKIVAEKFPQKVIHQFLPFDSPFFARKFVNHWRPDFVVWTESDFWANIITTASKVSRMILLNERMSDKSFKRWKCFPHLLKHILGCFNVVLPQSTIDYQKMEYFGVKNLNFIGNLKYSLNAANINQNLVDEVGEAINKRQVIFVASTHPTEEKIILESIKPLMKKHPDILIFLAPRHPARAAEVRNIINAIGFKYEQRTQTTKISQNTQLYLIDTLGEMNSFFKLSSITIMGGSFVSYINGHNIIEPAKFENAIICGPYMSNFKQAIEEFIEAKAIVQVNEGELSLVIDKLLSDNKLVRNYAANAHKIASSYEQVLSKTVKFLVAEFNR